MLGFSKAVKPSRLTTKSRENQIPSLFVNRVTVSYKKMYVFCMVIV